MENIQPLIEANDYVEDMLKYGHNHTFDEISFSRSKRNYEKILNTLSTAKLPDPLKFKYSNLTLEELKEYLLTILTNILGPEYRQQINTYNDMLKLEPIPNPFSAALETTYHNGNWVPLQIHISDELSTIEIVSTAHEYIHALLSKYIVNGYNEVLSNIHYKEFLSILVEYITCYIVGSIMPEEQLEYKQRANRVYAEHLMSLEHSDAQKLSIALNRLPSTDPNVALLKKYIIYDEHKTYGYIISNIFSNRLFGYYLDDEKKLLTFIRSIIAGEKSIKDLIQYYNLSLKSQDTIAPYTDLITKLSLK